MKVITIANQKGGIGKTTTAITLASTMQERGKRVLLIDTDMQCNSTDNYRAKTEDTATLYDVIIADEKDRVPIKDAIQHTECGDIIASDRLLIDADTVLKNDPVDGIYRLQEALRDEPIPYDYVIIDTNPTLNSLLLNCLVASDTVVIPVTTDRFALTGLEQLNDTINQVRKRPNRSLSVAGLLIIKYKERTNLGRGVRESLEKIAQAMGTRLFSTSIRESVRVQEAQAERVPLMKYAKDSTSAQDYEAFTDELLKDLEG